LPIFYDFDLFRGHFFAILRPFAHFFGGRHTIKFEKKKSKKWKKKCFGKFHFLWYAAFYGMPLWYAVMVCRSIYKGIVLIFYGMPWYAAFFLAAYQKIWKTKKNSQKMKKIIFYGMPLFMVCRYGMPLWYAAQFIKG